MLCWNLLPFSRGAVKITVGSAAFLISRLLTRENQSANPFTKPSVNVNYFSVDVDLDIQVASMRLGRRILTSPPLRYETLLSPVGIHADDFPVKLTLHW